MMERHGVRGSGRVQKLGDVAVIRVENPTGEFARDVASLLGARAVVNVRRIEGWERRPIAELLFGESGETVHRENGMLFKLDATKVMFSRGNSNERARMRDVVGEGERILDMFAGIGYFTVPMAFRGVHREMVAVEKNPVAFEYLVENIRLNSLRRVTPILSDNRDVSGTGTFDRIVMGYFPHTEEFLEKAWEFSKSSTVIHFHNSTKCIDEMDAQIREVFPDARIIGKRRVKRIGPSLSHFCIDFVANI